MCQLSNAEYYSKVEKDFTPDQENQINQCISELVDNGDVEEDIGKLLIKATNSRTPIFLYASKDPQTQQSRGSPVVSSSVNSHTEIISLCGRISKTFSRKTAVIH